MKRYIYYWHQTDADRYTASVGYMHFGEFREVEQMGDSVSLDHLRGLVETYYPGAKCQNDLTEAA